MRARWAIRVTYPTGDEAWLRHGSRVGAGPIATFASKELANINADFVRQGVDTDIVVTVVKRKPDPSVASPPERRDE